MPTTAGQFNNQTPFPGTLFLGAALFKATSASTGVTFVANAKGNYSLHLAAASTLKAVVELDKILRLPYQPNEQLQFQTSNVSGLPTGIPPIGPISGKPPIYSPLTTPQSKGVAVLGLSAIYSVGAVNLTSGTVGVAKTIWPIDNAATVPVITDIVAPTNLSLVQRANIYVTTIASTDQVMFSLAQTQVTVEINMVTPAGGTAELYGVNLSLSYNYA